MNCLHIDKTEIENTALQLKALLAVLSATDGGNVNALQEIPYIMEIAANMADEIYCTIVNAVEMEVK